MPRVILDLSALIPIRQANLLRRLTSDIRRGEIAVASYGLNRLRKNPRWRDWVERNASYLAVRPQLPEEHERFQELITLYGNVGCNPFISDDDLMAIAIASCRGWHLVMRDAAAESVARQRQVAVVAVDDFIRHLKTR